MRNPDKLLTGLNSQQMAAVTTLQGPVKIVAGAGTGKTTTIARRIAYGVESGAYNPSKILALSYTAKSAAELRDRLFGLGLTSVAVRTFHSAALAQLQYFWPIHTRAKLPTLEPNKSKLLARVAQKLGFSLDDRQLRDLLAEIEWRKYRLLSFEEYQGVVDRPEISGLSRPQVLQLVQGYEAEKLHDSVIDWEDVLLLTLGLLQAEPSARSYVHSQYRQFFVDEFQDISPLQWELLKTWLGRSTDLCIVGDTRQAIFGFAGADVTIMREFDELFEDVEVIELSSNYRSGQPILNLAREVVEESDLQIAGKGQNKGSSVQLVELASVADEATWIADSVVALLESGVKPSGLAALGRLTQTLEPVATELARRNIPFIQRGIPFFQQPVVSSAISLIRALQVSQSPEPTFVQLSHILRQLGWDPNPTGAFREDQERLAWIYARFESLGADASIADLIIDLENLQRAQYEPSLNAVTLATIHAAKGLEWQSVFLLQANDGLIPFGRGPQSPDRIEEERRLLYVAVTRAQKKLVISYSKIDGLERPTSPTRFLSRLRFEKIN